MSRERRPEYGEEVLVWMCERTQADGLPSSEPLLSPSVGAAVSELHTLLQLCWYRSPTHLAPCRCPSLCRQDAHDGRQATEPQPQQGGAPEAATAPGRESRCRCGEGLAAGSSSERETVGSVADADEEGGHAQHQGFLQLAVQPRLVEKRSRRMAQ